MPSLLFALNAERYRVINENKMRNGARGFTHWFYDYLLHSIHWTTKWHSFYMEKGRRNRQEMGKIKENVLKHIMCNCTVIVMHALLYEASFFEPVRNFKLRLLFTMQWRCLCLVFGISMACVHFTMLNAVCVPGVIVYRACNIISSFFHRTIDALVAMTSFWIHLLILLFYWTLNIETKEEKRENENHNRMLYYDEMTTNQMEFLFEILHVAIYQFVCTCNFQLDQIYFSFFFVYNVRVTRWMYFITENFMHCIQIRQQFGFLFMLFEIVRLVAVQCVSILKRRYT